MDSRRIALFGGSFDPPHLGHLAVARAARQALRLDSVLFAPVGTQPLKPQGASAGFDDRLAMTQLAAAGEPGFEVSLIDAPRANDPARPNYTIDTLNTLRTVLPAGTELFCLVGADSFLSLRQWHRAAAVPFAAEMIVASRPGQPLDDLTAALPDGIKIEPESAAESDGVELRTYSIADASGHSSRLYILPGLHVEVSATEIRTLGAVGAQTEGQLVPDAVAEYIRERGIYR